MAKIDFVEETANQIDFQPIEFQADRSSVSPGLPNQSSVAQAIASRPDSVQILKEELAKRYNVGPRNPMKRFTSEERGAALQPIVAALKAMAVPFQRLEAGVAAPALELQGGNFNLSDLVRASGQGFSGQQSPQLGDLIRTTGFGEKVPALGFGNVNELLAGATGLAGAAALGTGATKATMALAPKVGGVVTSIAKSKKGGAFPQAEGPKFLRGGLSKSEAARIQAEYGNSNGRLVDTIKTALNSKIDEANQAYQTAMDLAPEGKQINVRPAIEQAGTRLKRLGLITKDGNLTELGRSEIARDSVYGKLLDFYKSADAISGVRGLQGKTSFTQGQMIKSMRADRETLVNKDQYTFLRDKLNALYKGKPSDVDVSKVVNQFYMDGENSGIIGLQKARSLTRQAFRKQEMFLNGNTGDLKIATEQRLGRIGSKSTLSDQELTHIRELEQYIGRPIITDAVKINKLNRAAERFENLKKESLKWGVRGAVAGAGFEGGKKLVTGNF